MSAAEQHAPDVREWRTVAAGTTRIGLCATCGQDAYDFKDGAWRHGRPDDSTVSAGPDRPFDGDILARRVALEGQLAELAALLETIKNTAWVVGDSGLEGWARSGQICAGEALDLFSTATREIAQQRVAGLEAECTAPHRDEEFPL